MTSSASSKRRRPSSAPGAFFATTDVSADIIAARFDQAELPGKFDAIVFSWFCYCYILGTAERTAALAKARAHLNPAGRVVISYIAAETPPPTRATTIARAASRLTGADWRAEPNDHFYPVAGRTPLYAFQHSFGADELQREAGTRDCLYSRNVDSRKRFSSC